MDCMTTIQNCFLDRQIGEERERERESEIEIGVSIEVFTCVQKKKLRAQIERYALIANIKYSNDTKRDMYSAFSALFIDHEFSLHHLRHV